MKFEPVIGLEVHCQLATETKIFSPISARFGAAPNSQVSPICMGMPGVLPVLNRKAVDYAIRIGLATNCNIASDSIFARKHYFYPDLPKGYQISQYEEPLCEHGWIEIELAQGSKKKIGIIRIHLEEDAGKSIHAEEFVSAAESLVDLNRCGVPLVEIVSGPDISSPHEAYLYMRRIRQLVRYLGICDGNMEEGSLRCDANVSIRPQGEETFGTKTELKNMNSFRHVEKALAAEIARQISLVESGEPVIQETRLWDVNQQATVSMRSKEYAHDYRYFPEPDLLPLHIDEKWLASARSALPELPVAKRDRFVDSYGLSLDHANILTEEQALADYYEAVAREVNDHQKAANWVLGEVMRSLHEQKTSITEFKIRPAALAELLQLIEKATISESIAKRVFNDMLASDQSARAIVKEKGLEQVSDTGEIEKVVKEVLASHPDEFERLRQGEHKLLGFFVGQVMKASRGKANPKLVNQSLRKMLQDD